MTITGMIVMTPNRAKDARSLGADAVECSAMYASGKRCPNWSRWLLVDDQGADHRVCKLHANKADRDGSLTVVRT